jgi:hypothetical protein
VVLVVDIADSRLAPHQAESQWIYYYLEAGYSKPAPYFFIEALRNRLVGPILRAELATVDLANIDSRADGAFITGWLVFRVTNDGNVAAYRWDVVIESYPALQRAQAARARRMRRLLRAAGFGKPFSTVCC